ncbi:UPF0256 protein [Virgisporangium aliadipatigenens]|uniref:UPF0256 protein n=1 Tax=Virgisporangium aliadipatigenens TaxID=741659 RepID=A0A8J4DXB0_9ACTN|nr:GNAT family N-acetyltransferase [Virgisporangium aliadipatigenens]GIJ51912.1 UPF0256 protein [Virgisporangium aliadipatigenens]
MTAPFDRITTRCAAQGDWPGIIALLDEAFLGGGDPSGWDAERAVYAPERALVARDGERVVAHVASYGRDLAVPGGTLPAAHVALVAVAPLYRRRRLLSTLMQKHLVERRAAGESLAVLWASEGRIYQRFGYGLASTRLELDVDTRAAGLDTAPTAYLLEDAVPADAIPRLRDVYERLWRHRPGWSGRTDTWWRRLTEDPPARRGGATPLRALLAVADGQPRGYALWRAEPRWDDAGPRGTVDLRELVSADPSATRALWRFLFAVDLTRTLRYRFGAADDPLAHLLDEPRQLRATVADAHWVRLLDVAAALAGRRYRTPVDVVLEVRDALIPQNAGRYRLRGDRSTASCTGTTADADLTLDVRDLGAAYLGGTPLTALAAAGRVAAHRPGALDAAADAFSWRPGPSVVEDF